MSSFVSAPQNLGQLFLNTARKFSDRAAYLEFDCPEFQWRSWSWREIHQRILVCQAWLKMYDLKPGDCIGIMAPNGVDWVTLDIAATGCGLVVVPFHLQESPKTLSHILRQTCPRIILFGSVAQWRLLAQGIQALAPEERPLYCVSSQLVGEPTEGLEYFQDCLDRHQPLPEYFNCNPSGDTLATIVFTSGTTGLPKGVQLTHRNLIANMISATRAVPISSDDVFLSFLPLSHTFERTVGYYAPMMFGATVAYNRSIPKLIEDLAAIRPTVLISVPRIYEKVYAKIQEKVSTSVFNRCLLNHTVEIGKAYFLFQQGRGPWRLRFLLRPLLQRLVAKKILARFGGRVRCTISGGAPLAPEVAYFFIGLGLPILQGYGMTETSPVVSVNRLDDNVPESAGIVLDGVEVKLDESDELLVRGDNVMPGYWQNPEASAKILTPDGWLHTGDVARLEGNRLFIVGRIKEIVVLATGEKFPPAESETAILSSPLFEQAAVFGDKKPFACAVIVVNEKEWSKQAAERPELQAELQADLQNLAGQAAVQFALQTIKKHSKRVQHYAQVRGVVLTREPWTVENGLLSVTLKAKRPKIEAHYRDAIEAVYRKRRIA